jgi:predicted transcriptional regulator
MTLPKSSPKPTEGELSILAVLWERGPSTVRQVFEVLSRERDLGYTTVLKMLQIMQEKGLVARDESERTHVYRARESADATQATLVDDLMDRAFGGSAMKLVMHALASKKATQEELAEIRKLLEANHGRA